MRTNHSLPKFSRNSNIKNVIADRQVIGHSGAVPEMYCLLWQLQLRELSRVSKVLMQTQMPKCSVVWYETQLPAHGCLPVCCVVTVGHNVIDFGNRSGIVIAVVGGAGDVVVFFFYRCTSGVWTCRG